MLDPPSKLQPESNSDNALMLIKAERLAKLAMINLTYSLVLA
ncbi:hypothetical protein PUND_a1350 [Pseudoalteromonas undina]|nr:hypothetical protein PUND_a1350 [Pseudoalteromonas undina]